MKAKIFTLIAFCAFMSFGTTKAQLYMEENFDYPVDSFIKAPVISTANLQAISGWSTQTSTLAKNDCWNVVSPGLTYPGYYNETGFGGALAFDANTVTGQSVYKSWKHAMLQDSTFYISFLINFETNPAAILSPDYFFGIKMSGLFSDTNWGSLIYASYDPAVVGSEINLGIKKSSSGLATYATTNIPANTTHLFVLKYKLGKIQGTSSATEAVGLFDDQMSLFVNPPTTGGEPATKTLYNDDVNSKDLYRWGATKAFGGAVAVYLRAPAVVANTPVYTIDAIRVGLTWNDVMFVKTGLKSTTADNFKYSVDENKQISFVSSDYARYDIISTSGQRMLTGSLNSVSNKINASNLKSGIYIMNLHGNQTASAKILIP